MSHGRHRVMCLNDRPQSVLIEDGLDAFAEASCWPYLPGQDGSAPRSRPCANSGCTWRAISRASAASAVWSGSARVRFRCRRSCDWGAVIGYRNHLTDAVIRAQSEVIPALAVMCDVEALVLLSLADTKPDGRPDDP